MNIGQLTHKYISALFYAVSILRDLSRVHYYGLSADEVYNNLTSYGSRGRSICDKFCFATLNTR